MENWIYWSFGGTCDSKISAKFHKRDGSNAKRPIIIDLKYIADFKMVKKLYDHMEKCMTIIVMSLKSF